MNASAIDKVAEHLDVNVEEKMEVRQKKAGVKEVSLSMKVTPKNTYSSVEYSQTVEIYDNAKGVVDGVKAQLRKDVLEEAIDAGKALITRMIDEGML